MSRAFKRSVLVIVVLVTDWLSSLGEAQTNREQFIESGDTGNKVAKLLNNKLDWEYHNVPLDELCKLIGRRLEMEVCINKESLDDAGLSSDVPLSLRARSLRAKQFLNLLLAPHGLTWVFRDNSIEVTTNEWAENHPENVTIDVSHLRIRRRVGGPSQSPSDAIMDLVQTVVPDGGVGTVSIDSNRLTVSQTGIVIDEIRGLLTALRRSNEMPAQNVSLVSIGIDEGADEIWAALIKQVDLASAGSLENLAERISEGCAINVLIDKKSFDDAGEDTSKPITLRLKGTLGNELQRALEPLKLGWKVVDGTLVIGIAESIAAHQEIRCYLVQDLVQSHDALRGLTRQLESSIAPQSWEVVGGVGIIKEVVNPAVLVVNQSSNVHRQIMIFLADQRAKKSQPTKKDGRP